MSAACTPPLVSNGVNTYVVRFADPLGSRRCAIGAVERYIGTVNKPASAIDFLCYADLAQSFVEGVDYAVHVEFRAASRVAVLAPHGGRIEGRTSEIARLIAGEERRLYLFEGLRPTGDNFECLHLGSHCFDEPRAIELIADCDTVIAVHGYAASGPDVLLGGLNEGLKRKVARALRETGFTYLTDGHRFPGSHPRNICNRGRSGAGLQLELSEGLRKSGDWVGLAEAVRSAAGGL